MSPSGDSCRTGGLTSWTSGTELRQGCLLVTPGSLIYDETLVLTPRGLQGPAWSREAQDQWNQPLCATWFQAAEPVLRARGSLLLQQRLPLSPPPGTHTLCLSIPLEMADSRKAGAWHSCICLKLPEDQRLVCSLSRKPVSGVLWFHLPTAPVHLIQAFLSG